MKIISVLLILAGLSALVYIYHDRIETWFPGYKTKVWNSIIAILGVLGTVFTYLQENTGTFGSFLTPQNAGLAAITIGVVGLLINMVTKRA